MTDEVVVVVGERVVVQPQRGQLDWFLDAHPEGAWASLTSTHDVGTSFVPDVEGPWHVRGTKPGLRYHLSATATQREGLFDPSLGAGVRRDYSVPGDCVEGVWDMRDALAPAVAWIDVCLVQPAMTPEGALLYVTEEGGLFEAQPDASPDSPGANDLRRSDECVAGVEVDANGELWALSCGLRWGAVESDARLPVDFDLKALNQGFAAGTHPSGESVVYDTATDEMVPFVEPTLAAIEAATDGGFWVFADYTLRHLSVDGEYTDENWPIPRTLDSQTSLTFAAVNGQGELLLGAERDGDRVGHVLYDPRSSSAEWLSGYPEFTEPFDVVVGP